MTTVRLDFTSQVFSAILPPRSPDCGRADPTSCLRALKALFTRWPKLELAVADSEIRWLPRPGLRALASLPVRPG